jgi:hypothetical protein
MRHLAPGREHEARPGNDKEMAATTVMRISLAEAACKVRNGGPSDDAEDMGVAAWAGVLPLVQQRGMPVADALNTQPVPTYVQQWGAAPATAAR